MEIERYGIIESDAQIVQRSVVNKAEVEGHNFPAPSPDEKANSIRHSLPDEPEELLVQLLVLEIRSVERLQVQWMDFVHEQRCVLQDCEFDGRSTLRSSQFPPQVLAEDLAQPAIHEFVERRKIQVQARGRHAWRAL